MDKKKRWKLQIYWDGDWRTILESDARHELVTYANSCAEDLEIRIIDSSEEEVKKHGRRRDQPV